MFKNLFFRKNKITKRIFLTGGEEILNGDQYSEFFIATQITNKATVKSGGSGIELVFKNNKLIKSYNYREGCRMERKLYEKEIGLQYKEYKENRILNLIEDEKGMHQLGGEIPCDFQLPDNNCVVPFQYLGFIDNNDTHFSWLPFKIHLTCPIYLEFETIFLDYSNPNKPYIINKDEVEKAFSTSDDLNKNFEIVFNELKISFVENNEFCLEGNSGIPSWIQYSQIPTCPKSGNRMKLICQLYSHDRVTTKRTNVETKDERERLYYYENLNFWGGGELYIFFEPTSKVACYFIQNT